jgi:hypothetical protein
VLLGGVLTYTEHLQEEESNDEPGNEEDTKSTGEHSRILSISSEDA